jgi:hypothetical protein
MVMTTETDTAGCTRNTNGTSCGTSTFGHWSACSYADACSETGTRTRTRTDSICSNGTCTTVTTTETDSTGCTRSTSGQSCGTTQYGSWSACSYGSTCANSGSRTRSVTTYTCGNGTCNASTTTETDTAGCARNTDGTSCGSTQYGSWSACSYGSTCANSGSRTRDVTTYTCQAGSCSSSTTTQTDTSGCARNTDGTSCGTTTYGSWSACSYADACTNSGVRTRSMTSYVCGNGSCNTITGTDTSGCARNTDGQSCGADQCTTCTSCQPDCIREQECTVYRCGGGVCNASTEYRICGSCPPGCVPL